MTTIISEKFFEEKREDQKCVMVDRIFKRAIFNFDRFQMNESVC